MDADLKRPPLERLAADDVHHVMGLALSERVAVVVWVEAHGVDPLRCVAFEARAEGEGKAAIRFTVLVGEIGNFVEGPDGELLNETVDLIQLAPWPLAG